MTRIDAAWLAGIIDGEGYIDTSRREIQITNCDQRLLRRAKAVSGCGAIYTAGNPRRSNHRQCYNFRIGAKADVGRVLTSVQPWLITKRAKCRKVLRDLT